MDKVEDVMWDLGVDDDGVWLCKFVVLVDWIGLGWVVRY